MTKRCMSKAQIATSYKVNRRLYVDNKANIPIIGELCDNRNKLYFLVVVGFQKWCCRSCLSEVSYEYLFLISLFPEQELGECLRQCNAQIGNTSNL